MIDYFAVHADGCLWLSRHGGCGDDLLYATIFTNREEANQLMEASQGKYGQLRVVLLTQAEVKRSWALSDYFHGCATVGETAAKLRPLGLSEDQIAELLA